MSKTKKVKATKKVKKPWNWKKIFGVVKNVATILIKTGLLKVSKYWQGAGVILALAGTGYNYFGDGKDSVLLNELNGSYYQIDSTMKAENAALRDTIDVLRVKVDLFDSAIDIIPTE